MQMQVNSVYLNRMVNIGIVRTEKYERILILLHGYNGSFADMDRNLPLLEYATKYKMLICIPDLGNAYYIDRENISYSMFIAEELPDILIQQYRMEKEVDFILAGISMGGYGSMLIGLNKPERFSAIISISGAFIAKDVAIGNPQVVGSDATVNQFFLDVFHPVSTLENSPDRNPEAAIDSVDIENVPFIIVTCGEDDLLYDRNVELVRRLQARNIKHVWCPISGNHEFGCFSEGIVRALEMVG